jgi:cobaltochelatase CobT
VAVGLLVRQHLTGRPLPPSAEHVVQFWRDYVEEHAGEDISRLREHLMDQGKFADVCRRILVDLGLEAELDEPTDFDDSQDDVETVDEGDEADRTSAPKTWCSTTTP